MKKSVLLFLGLCLSFVTASAQSINFTTKTKLTQVQCGAVGQAFKIRKKFPAIIDDTFLTLKPVSDGGGTFEYRSEFSGLSGGDCKIQFTGRYDVGSQDILTIQPDRSTYKTSNGGFDSACETLRIDMNQIFVVKRIEGRTTDPVYLQLDGKDVTNLCGGAARGNLVRFLFVIVGQGSAN